MLVVFTQVTTATVNIFQNCTFMKEDLKIQNYMVKAQCQFIAEIIIKEDLQMIIGTVLVLSNA